LTVFGWMIGTFQIPSITKSEKRKGIFTRAKGILSLEIQLNFPYSDINRTYDNLVQRHCIHTVKCYTRLFFQNQV
jgi:hypothetical protein